MLKTLTDIKNALYGWYSLIKISGWESGKNNIKKKLRNYKHSYTYKLNITYII